MRGEECLVSGSAKPGSLRLRPCGAGTGGASGGILGERRSLDVVVWEDVQPWHRYLQTAAGRCGIARGRSSCTCAGRPGAHIQLDDAHAAMAKP